MSLKQMDMERYKESFFHNYLPAKFSFFIMQSFASFN